MLGGRGRTIAALILTFTVTLLIPQTATFAAPPTEPISNPPGSPKPVVQIGSGGGQAEGDTTVIATVGSSGTNPTGGSPTPAPQGSTNAGSSSPDPCWYLPVAATKGEEWLGGDDPSEGVLYIVSCPDAINLNSGDLVYSSQGYLWVRNGSPVMPPPPDPAQIAQEASGQLVAPNPMIHLGPDTARIAVKVPVWLWVDSPQPLELTVAVRGLSVTVKALMTSTTWSTGEPVDQSSPSKKSPAFTCQGAGTPAPASPEISAKPPCGYTYTWKSLANRTSGTGTWPLTATTNWNVTWAASNGTNGTLPQPLTPSTTQQVAVGEWRSSLVAGSGR